MSGFRRQMLKRVHSQLDPLQNGYLSRIEIDLLGQSFSTYNPHAHWTPDMTDEVMEDMDPSGDGRVRPDAFAEFFDSLLPQDPFEFEQRLGVFSDVAADHLLCTEAARALVNSEYMNSAVSPKHRDGGPAAAAAGGEPGWFVGEVAPILSPRTLFDQVSSRQPEESPSDSPSVSCEAHNLWASTMLAGDVLPTKYLLEESASTRTEQQARELMCCVCCAALLVQPL